MDSPDRPGANGGSPTARIPARIWHWIEPEHNPSGVVYGTIAVGAILATEDAVRATFAGTLAATIIALALYWLAHTYAHLSGERLKGHRSLRAREMLHSLAHEWSIIKGSAVPVIVLAICWVAGAGLGTAVTAALWASAATLAAFEIAVAVQGGGRWYVMAGEAGAGCVLGAGLLLLHAVLH